ncbi:hypothetical protein SNE40_017079 [Patella caerulea]
MLAGAAIIAVTVHGIQVDPPTEFPLLHDDSRAIYEDDYWKPFNKDRSAHVPRNPLAHFFRPKFGRCEETKRKLRNLASELAYLSEAISALADKREDRPYYKDDTPYYREDRAFYKDETPYYREDRAFYKEDYPYYQKW